VPLGVGPRSVFFEESVVKRGKRKAVDLDDAPPWQTIQHRVDDFVSAFYVYFSLSS
jgi:hypothetical protein